MKRFRSGRRTAAIIVASIALLGGSIGTAGADSDADVLTFADEDRSSELTNEPAHQRYQFSSPTTVTFDRNSISSSADSARVYVADMGQHVIRVLDLDGRQIGQLDETTAMLDPASPATAVPPITAPLGLAFLSESEADDPRHAGLYVNDVASHSVHFFRTDPTDPNSFRYVTSIGEPGDGAGEEMTLPRNLAVLPQGLLVVSDEFNHRIKAFELDPETWSATLVGVEGHHEAGVYRPAGPILPGQDRHFGADSENYDDYADNPEKINGFRIPQGQAYWRSPADRTFLYVADNGNNRIKIFEVAIDGTFELVDMLSRIPGSDSGHLKRPRGVAVDAHGNLFVADTFGGQILRINNLDNDGGVRYRPDSASDVETAWVYGHMGIHQIEMRTPGTALVEDGAFQLPNDAIPVLNSDGERYTEDVLAWGQFYRDAPVLLVSDTGNHRIKKCWEHPSQNRILRCSISAGVAAAPSHEFWGHPRTLAGQLHYVSALEHLPALDSGSGTILVSETPNSVIEEFSMTGEYLGRFTGGRLSWGVTGLAVLRDAPGADDRRVAALLAADATLPWPYTGDSSLRIYRGDGILSGQFNLTYRTTGRGAPRISYVDSNLPVAVAVSKVAGYKYNVFVTTTTNHLWKFTYDASRNSLNADWVVGGPDPEKGTDGDGEWEYGPAFFAQGAPGTFDQIQDVTAGRDRVYATDRRNQRIQVFSADDGTLLGRIGAGGGTYDHPSTLSADEFFLPHGVHLNEHTQTFLVGDGFNFVARSYSDPSRLRPNPSGQIKPGFIGYWLDPSLGTRAGGLFATQHVLQVDNYIYVDSLISNRLTRFDADSPNSPVS